MKRNAMLILTAILIVLMQSACSPANSVDEGKEYIMPRYLVSWHGPEYTAQDVVAGFRENNNDTNNYVDVYANEDGTVSLVMNPDQVAAMRDSCTQMIVWAQDMAAGRDCEMKVSEDRTAFSYKVRAGLSHAQRVTPLSMVQTACIFDQILSDVDAEALSLSYEIYNAESGELIASGTLPRDSLDQVEIADSESLGLTQSFYVNSGY